MSEPKVTPPKPIVKGNPRIRVSVQCKKTVQEAQYEPFSIEMGIEFEMDGPMDAAASLASMSDDIQTAVDNALHVRRQSRCPHGLRFGLDHDIAADCDRCEQERHRMCFDAMPRKTRR